MRYFIEDIWFALWVMYTARIGCRDAIDYRRSKSAQKKLRKEMGVLRRILRIYPLKISFAPRHMRLFLLVRAICLFLLVVEVLVFVFWRGCSENVWRIVFISKISCIYAPFYLYLIVRFHMLTGPKILDFDRVDNP